MPDLSIIIVNYKTPDLLLQCIRSINLSEPGYTYEVIVCDNHSEDNSQSLICSEFPSVKWINIPYNSGFGRANNAGIRMAQGEYLLLLNSDTVIGPAFLNDFLNCYKQINTSHQLGLLGCRIKSLTDNSLLVGSGRGFYGLRKILDGHPLIIYLQNLTGAVQKPAYKAATMHQFTHEVDFVSGACVMIKKDKLITHNLYLDEDFFLYYEDVEWSFRVQSSGLRNYFCADIEVRHINAGSSTLKNSRNRQIQVSSYLYLRKRYGTFKFWLSGVVLRTAFQINLFLLKRKGQTDIFLEYQKQYAIFREYFPRTWANYKRSLSSSKEYLKYVEKDS